MQDRTFRIWNTYLLHKAVRQTRHFASTMLLRDISRYISSRTLEIVADKETSPLNLRYLRSATLHL
jgi:hypothetical protein